METIRTCRATFALFAAVLLAGILTADAKGEDLSKEARITKSQAERTALGKVTHGAIKTAELEHEHGKLIWSFDISQAGTKDIKEVQVDAINGKIVSIETESPKDQRKEAAADKKK